MRTRLDAQITVFATLAAVFAALVTALAPCAAAAVTPNNMASPGARTSVTEDAVRPLTQGQTGQPATDTTAPPGPRIEPEESEQANEDEAQRKAIVAAVAAALLVIVIFGRKARNKSKPGKDS